MFTRFADLFGGKAANRGLVVFSDEDRGVHSEAFRLWCRKLAGLTPENFKTGIDGVERKAESDYRDGHEMWPPSYAEFRALCFPKAGRDTQAHKVFERLPALEDQTAKAKRYELGREKSRELLAMLGVPEPIINPGAIGGEVGLQRLQEAKAILERGPL